MKQALALVVLIFAALVLGAGLVSYQAVLLVVYGALSLMALMIAGTFLWLYVQRTTPLALGMAYSWAGAGLFAGWWWVFNLTGRADWVVNQEGALAVLALALVGALLHFAVIQRSFGFHGASFLAPVGLALGLSALVYALV